MYSALMNDHDFKKRSLKIKELCLCLNLFYEIMIAFGTLLKKFFRIRTLAVPMF